VSFHRTIWDHDGVTDIVVTVPVEGQPSILQLESPLRNAKLIHHEKNTYWLQDEHSRITILTSEEKRLSSHGTSNGVVVVEIPITSSVRIRLIVEDLDTVHQGGNETENYFALFMALDFLKPLAGGPGAAYR
jgi:hypothetical protein